MFTITDGANAAGLNYIRVPIGASDFSASGKLCTDGQNLYIYRCRMMKARSQGFLSIVMPARSDNKIPFIRHFHLRYLPLNDSANSHLRILLQEIYFTECTGIFGSDWWTDMKVSVPFRYLGCLISHIRLSIVVYG